MKRIYKVMVLSAVLVVGLGPVLFAGGAVADDSGTVDAQPSQSGLLDELIDSFVGDGSDEESDDDGFFGSFVGEDESFDGYPDGFSEDGIDDFEQALGERSVHYTADSMSYEAEATTPDSESFELSAQASAEAEQALLISETPDGERVHYLDGNEGFIAVDGDYQRESASFDRDELYAVTDISRDLREANLSKDTIDGDTVIYISEDQSVELAVRDTGELDYIEIEDDESVFVDFYDYDATTVDEPSWVDDARDVTDEPADEPEPPTEEQIDERDPTTDVSVDDPSIQEEIDRHVPDDAEPGTRFEFVTSDGIEVAAVINQDGEPEVIGRIDRSEVDTPTNTERPDRDDASEERLRERAERIEERIDDIEDQIDQLEDQDSTDDRHDADEQIADLEDRIDRHQDRIAELEADIDEIEAGEWEAELREEIADLEDEREALEDERTELGDRYAEADDEELRAQLRAEREDVLGEIATVETEIEQAESQLDSFDPADEIAQRQNRIDSSEDRIENLREQIARAEDHSTTDNSDQIERLEERKADLENQIDRIEERLEESDR